MAGNNIYIQVDFQSDDADAQIKKLNTEIASIAKASEATSKSSSQSFKGFSVSIEETERAVFGLGQAIAALGFVRLGAEMAQTADKINKIEVAFQGMLGSAQKASDMMAILRSTAEKTPFAFEDIAEGAQRLKAFGVESSKIPTFLTAIANAAAAMGGTKEKIDSITNAIGQMYAKDEAQSAQLFRGLLKQGVPVLDILQKAIKKSTGEILSPQDIQKLIEKGQLGGRATADAIVEGMQERFAQAGGGMMSLVTVQFTKLTDELQKFAVLILADVAPAMNVWIARLKEVVTWFEALPEPVRKLIEALGALAAAVTVLNVVWQAFGALLGTGILGSAIRGFMGLSTAIATATAEGATFGTAFLGAVMANIPAAITGIRAVTVAFQLLGAAMVGWWLGGKIVEWMEAFRKAVGGLDNIKDLGLRAIVNLFTDQADKTDKANALLSQSAAQALEQNEKLRARALTEVGKLALRGLPKLDLSADAAAIDQQNRQILQMINDRRTEVQEQMIQADKAMLQHLDDITAAALEKAQARELGGYAAIAHEVADLNREIEKAKAGIKEKPVASLETDAARVALVAQLDTQHLLNEGLKKASEERRKLEQTAALDRIADLKKASELEVELAKQTAVETQTARAQAQAAGYAVLLANEQHIREATSAALNVSQRAQLGTYLQEAIREKKTEHPEQLQQEIANLLAGFRVEREKADKESYERVAKYRVDIEKQVIAQAQQLNEQALDVQNQNLLDRAQHAGDLQKALVNAVPAQTEEQRTAQANAAAQAEINAANLVYAAQKDINQQLYDDRLYALKEFLAAGLIQQQEYIDAVAAMDKLRIAETQKLDQDRIFETQKLEIEAMRKHNEAVIQDQKEVYDQLKSGIDKLWDALTARSETFAQRIGNLFKTAFLTAAKDIVTSHAAAALTEQFGKGHVGFGGGPLRQLLGKEPIFGADKMQQPGHLGDVTTVNAGGLNAVPVWSVNQPTTGSDVTQNFHITTAAASLPAVVAAGAMAAQVAARGGSSSGINATFSRLIGGGESPSVTPGFSSAGGGSSWTSNPFSQLPLFSSPGGAGAVGGGGSLESIFRNVPGFSGGAGPGLNDLPITGGGMSTSAFGLPGALGGLSKFGSLAKMLGIGSGGGGGAVNLLPGSILPGLGVGAGIAGLGAARQLGTHGAGGLVGGAVLGAASGALTFSALAALFPILIAAGPIGLIAAAGIGAAIGLSSLFIKTADQKVRSKVKQVYGVDISEKNIRMQIVQIAKDRYGGNLDVAIASPEVQEIVRMYSIATGKNPSGLPRPMYGATFTQSGAGGVSLQPVYQGGNIVANPYTGTTTTQYAQAGQQLMFMQLDPTAASQLLTGQVTQVMAANPSTVAAAAAAGVGNGSARDAMNNALIEPLTVMS